MKMDVTFSESNVKKIDVGFSGSSQKFNSEFKGTTVLHTGIEGLHLDETLKWTEDGKLAVNTTNEVNEDNTLPITSAAVAVQVGNIETILKTI